MKKKLRIAVVASLVVFILLSDVIFAQGIRRRTRRRTAVVVGTTAHAAGAAQGSAAAQQQTAAAQQQAASAEQRAAAAEQDAASANQRAAAAEQDAAAARGQLPVGTVADKLPAGCATTAIGGQQYYKCGVNYYRAVFQGNNLVYVTAQPK